MPETQTGGGVRTDAALLAARRVPRATYRLQMCRAFTFRDALQTVPYLHALGVSDLYLSPILKSGPESDHGYDICDPLSLDPKLGTPEEFEQLGAALRQRGMGLVLDTVPNHMGIEEPCNSWWMDVLENGPSSAFASYFDITWQPVRAELANKVLLPILEDQYGRVLEDAKLNLQYGEGSFWLAYYDKRFPLAPRSYALILQETLAPVSVALGTDHEQFHELQSILTALSYLPDPREQSPERIAERIREKEVIKRRLDALASGSEVFRDALQEVVRVLNGRQGDSGSFDKLDDIITAQAYRPAFWRVATEEINYRRFFDINGLAAIRVELPEVFAATHELTSRLFSEGLVTGIRVDHPDGLRNPRAYFRQLQETLLRGRYLAGPAAPLEGEELERRLAAWSASFCRPGERGLFPPPVYTVAEKILSSGETIPEDWAVDGTTGYDFLNLVNGLFVDSDQRRTFDRIYADFSRMRIEFEDLVNDSKKLIMEVALSGEINALAHHLARIAGRNRRCRDFTLASLAAVISEVIAALPVYRTYVTEEGPISETDRAFVEMAVARARARNPRTAREIFEFVRDTLLLRNLDQFPEADRAELISFVMTFQQMTGPVMAKGFEDTAFYVYNRLISLNEVGGQPGVFGSSVPEFHRRNLERLSRRPHSLLATSTHDAKRGEDVRARINVLSEIPAEWRAALSRWRMENRSRKRTVDRLPAPSANDELFYYQTLIGAWPTGTLTAETLEEFRRRMGEYMGKAVKEAKARTNWLNPNLEYEDAVQAFVRETLTDSERNRFYRDIAAFQARIAWFGRLNSLSQTTLKLTSPGVPDLYQGTELWDLNLVDPDNRRPVDYEKRAALLREWQKAEERPGDPGSMSASRVEEEDPEGRMKLYVISRLLRYRQRQQDLFDHGDYLPVDAGGPQSGHVCAFARLRNEIAVVVAVPRLVVGLLSGMQRLPTGRAVWKDTELLLPPGCVAGSYRNVLTGETVVRAPGEGEGRIAMSAACSSFPVAVLEARVP